MSEAEVFYVCRECAKGKSLEELRLYQPLVTLEGDTTRWDCPECGRNIMIAIDQGTLELGIVRDSQLKDRFDWEVFD